MQHIRKRYSYARLLADLVLLLSVFFLAAYWARQRMLFRKPFFFFDTQVALLLPVILLSWVLAADAIGLYDEFRARNFSFELLALLRAALVQAVVVTLTMFLIKTGSLSRFFTLAFFLGQLLLLGAWKTLLRVLLRSLRRRGRNLRFVIIVGCGELARKFQNTVAQYAHLGYRVAGFVDDAPPSDCPDGYLGRIDELERIVTMGQIDEVVIALPNSEVEKIDRVISLCQNLPLPMRIIPDFFQYLSPHFSISLFADVPIISLRTVPLDDPTRQLAKRLFDLAITGALFVLVFWWLWALIALAIKVSSPGPIFFKQERWGRKNRRIVCYKFRTMVAASRDVDEAGRYQQATRDDPRVTKIGRFLRRSNLDELPQLLNVLKGEMSLVGPRPHPTPLNQEAKDRIANYLQRHLVKPGVTGWAQVNGWRGETRNEEQMQKRVEHDIWYIENWTFLLDIQILLLTLWLMLRGDQKAY